MSLTLVSEAGADGDIFSLFDEWVDEYKASVLSANQKEIEEVGVALAAERRMALRQLIASDPEAALALSYSEADRAGLPAAVLSLLEDKVEGAGKWAVVAISGGEVTRTATIEGKSFTAFVGARLSGIDSLSNAYVEGIAVGRFLAVGELTESSRMAPFSEPEGDFAPLEESMAMGRKSIVVIRATFSNMAGVEPIAVEESYSVVQKAHAFLKANSYNQFSFRLIQVTENVVVLPGSSGDYLPQESSDPEVPDETVGEAIFRLLGTIQDTAVSEGYLSEYDIVVAVVPSFGLGALNGGAGGVSIVGEPLSFIEGGESFTPANVSWNLSTNLGLWSSHYWKPFGVGENYPVREGRQILRANAFDLMGGGELIEVPLPPEEIVEGGPAVTLERAMEVYFPKNHLSGNFKNIVGWLPDENIHILPDEESTGIYRIHRLDGGASLQENRRHSARLVIANPAPPAGSNAPVADYWIDFRPLFTDSPDVVNEVVLQWGDAGSNLGSHLINANRPVWPIPEKEAPLIEETPLALGDTYSDPYHNIHITPVKVGGVAPNEYVDVIITRGVLNIELLRPLPEPSVVDPLGAWVVPQDGTVRFEFEAEATVSPLSVVEVYDVVSGAILGTAERIEETNLYRLDATISGYPVGLHRFRGRLMNEAGNVTTTEEIPVRVTEVELVLVAGPVTVIENETISFIVIGSEEAGPFAAAEVFINGESVGTVVTDGETVLEWSSAEPGIFHAYAVAFNEEEQSFRSATIEVRVVYSEGIAFSFGELPESTILGDPVSLSVEMAEEDAIPFQVEYLVDGEAIATVSEEPFEHIWIAETPGTYELRAVVSLEEGLPVISPVQTVTVVLPELSLSASVDVAVPGENVTLITGMNSANWVPIAVEYWRNGELYATRDTLEAITFVPPFPGTHEVEVRAWDGFGNEAVSAFVTVEALEPTASVNVSTPFAMLGEPVEISATLNTPGWVPARVEYWIDGVLFANGSDWAPVAYTPTRSGYHRIEVRAQDSLGNWAMPGFITLAVNETLDLSWSMVSSGVESDLLGGAVGAGRIVVAGADGTVLYSDDGVSWTPVSLTPAFNINSVAYGAGLFVAVGDGGRIITSDDGIVWESADSGVTRILRGISYHAGQFLAVGDNGAILLSENGLDWTPSVSPVISSLWASGYGFGRWYAVGNAGVILSSENGVNWVKEVSPTEENLRGITFGKRMMHIVGGKRLSLLVSNGILLSSTNGAEWEVRLTNKMLRSVAFDGNSFLAAGYEGALFSSYDGNLWREATTPVLASFAGAVAHQGRFIAYGDAGAIWVSGPVVGDPATYLKWLSYHLDAWEIRDPDLTSPVASGADGTSSLFKYALGFDPDSTVTPADLPRAVWVEEGGLTTGGFIFRVSTTASDLNVVVEVSSDLTNWEPLDESAVVSITDRGHYREVTVIDNRPGEPALRSFFRLNIGFSSGW